MTERRIITFLFMIALIGCKGDPKTKAPAETQGAEISSPPEETIGGEVTGGRDFCYVRKSAAPSTMGEAYNYDFIRFRLNDGDKVEGTFLSSPYGTDGSRGSISGIYQEDQKRFQTTTTYLAEGEYYEEQRDYEIGAEGVSLLDDSGKPIITVPVVSCEKYTVEMRAYQQGILKKKVNTTDRSRLKQVKEVNDFGYTQQQLDNLRFMELEIDLDNDYTTREYLLYIMDPMVCGSGGCNLLIIDENGKTLSNTTVVKLPIYLPATTVEGMKSKGSWKPLYVWSQGFRKLDSEDGKYPSNASMATEVPQEELEGHPENYQLVLDYLE